MKFIALSLATLALLPSPAHADVDYSLGSDPILLNMSNYGALEAMPNFSASVEADGVHVFIEVQRHHRYGTFFVVFQGSARA